MKKFVILLSAFLIASHAHAAMKFSDAYAANGKTPMAVLIYANWADNYSEIINEFRQAQKIMGNDYNYVELDLASKDAKDFTEINSILTQLPYIMLYRSNGRFARYINRSCSADKSCFIPKMKSFIKQ